MQASSYRRLKVLVADDNHDVADSLAALIALLDYDVRTAYGGSSAIELAGSFRPDVIILDVDMPGMNGLQAARVLGTDRRLDHTTLIAHTAIDEPLVRRIAMQSGFHHLVPKGRNDSLTAILDLLVKLSSDGSGPEHRRHPPSRG